MKISNPFKRDTLEYEFLPAALEITEKPPAPLGRLVLWLIVAILVTAAVWTYLGKTDEVAIATGKIIPDGRSKIVQPVEGGTITAINVKEGQYVKAGEALITLDTTDKEADVAGVKQSLEMAKLERSLLAGGDIYQSGLPSDTISDIINQTDSKRGEYSTQLDAAIKALGQSKERLAATQSDLRDLQTQLKTAQDSGNTSQVSYLQEQILSQEDRVSTASQSLTQAQANVQGVEKNYNSTRYSTITDQDEKISQLESQLTKAENALALMTVKSPIDGTVHSLATTTVGGVVATAQQLMIIVPKNATLVVEASILNRDRGYIHIGQEVAIKIDTFPYQRYGTVKGHVSEISPDAVDDQKQGSVYKTLINFDKIPTRSGDTKITLTSGMTVSTEVKTGQRRIIEFFLEPLLKAKDESLRLR